MIIDIQLSMTNEEFDKLHQPADPNSLMSKIVKKHRQDRMDQFSKTPIDSWVLNLIKNS